MASENVHVRRGASGESVVLMRLQKTLTACDAFCRDFRVPLDQEIHSKQITELPNSRLMRTESTARGNPPLDASPTWVC